MTLPTSELAYQDCYAILDAALADEQGVKVRLATKAQAYHLRQRAHYARSLDRRKNLEVYPEVTDPMHGISYYDKLTLRVIEDTDEGCWWVSVEQNGVIPGEVVSLSTGNSVAMALPVVPALPPPPADPTPPDLGAAFDALPGVPEPEPRTPLAEILPPLQRPRPRRV